MDDPIDLELRLGPPPHRLPRSCSLSAQRPAPRSTRSEVINSHPPTVHQGDADASATVPARVRAELFPRHDLPEDLPVHFVGEKDLQSSDVSARQARFLIPSKASGRLRANLSAEEIEACGLGSTGRTAITQVLSGQDGEKRRAAPTTYAGVPVSVYELGGEWEAAELRLNKFHRSDGTVINGRGYRGFIARCGFRVGDRVEVWAFRRPPQHLCVCFVVVKRDQNQLSGDLTGSP